MNKGFYKELESLKIDYPEADFGFLENEYNQISLKDCLSAYDCLHGICDIFSLELSKIFGYEIEQIVSKEDGLVHAYCKKNIDEKTYFIDIRGVTDDYREFISEFDDFLEYFGTPKYPLEGTEKLENLDFQEFLKKFYTIRFSEYSLFCEKIIIENKEYYKI